MGAPETEARAARVADVLAARRLREADALEVEPVVAAAVARDHLTVGAAAANTAAPVGPGVVRALRCRRCGGRHEGRWRRSRVRLAGVQRVDGRRDGRE